MSPALAVQTKKYGSITAFDLLHERRLIASLIKEKANLVDYSHQLTFESLEAAVEFYLMAVNSTLEPRQGPWKSIQRQNGQASLSHPRDLCPSLEELK